MVPVMWTTHLLPSAGLESAVGVDPDARGVALEHPRLEVGARLVGHELHRGHHGRVLPLEGGEGREGEGGQKAVRTGEGLTEGWRNGWGDCLVN